MLIWLEMPHAERVGEGSGRIFCEGRRMARKVSSLGRAARLHSGTFGKQIAEKNMMLLGLGKGEAICL